MRGEEGAQCPGSRAAARGKAGIPAGLDPEAFAEVLSYLPAADLLATELVSRATAGLIAYRDLWRHLFLYQCQCGQPQHRRLSRRQPCCSLEHWQRPPASARPPSWKRFYHRYAREFVAPHCVRRRSTISATYVWRVPRLESRLSRHLDIHCSPEFGVTATERHPFCDERMRIATATNWRLLLQAHRDHSGLTQVGIFLQQEESWYRERRGLKESRVVVPPAHCYFSLATLDHNYDRIPGMTHSAEKRFQRRGVGYGNTCGWFFQVDKLKQAGVLSETDELIVELDLTVFPSELSYVKPLYDLILSDSSDHELKRVVVQSLGDFVTHHAPNPLKAKRCLQTEGGGPVPLVDLFGDPSAPGPLRAAVAGCLWNILDTSCVYIRPELLRRIVAVACETLHEVMARSGAAFTPVETPCKELTVWGSPPSAGGGRAAGGGLAVPAAPCDGAPPACRTVFPAPVAEGAREPSDEDKLLVNALCGLMWNIPTTDENRRLLSSHWAFYPGMAAVLSQGHYRRSHFSCLHLLTTLKRCGYFPTDPETVRSFGAFLKEYMEQAGGDRDDGVSNQDIGVALSLRDVADFFIPLLWSRDLDCVAFGKWAIAVFYWNTNDG